MIEKTSNIIVPWALGNGMPEEPASFKLVDLFAAKNEIFIGRSPENDIWLNHPAVSRIHAS
ncbi:MAG: FHA domain-containing protein, partial [Gemmataceae bacterium]|nr:FHA domain-containing protein [Gemmataceae bacterium]